ncbi:MAG: cation-transporting P-type ATPase, partial [Elusimicrobiales bacterium]|nr:cation-transporting P-type ATPase [Elusimicrobiales bacterium]
MTQNTLWHSISKEDAVSKLGTDAAAGLTAEEAAARLKERGPNLLREKPPRNPWLILWEQFNSALMLVLAAAAVIAFLTHDRGDAAVIAAILILNAALGFWQEYKADRAMEALKKMAAPVVRALSKPLRHLAGAPLLLGMAALGLVGAACAPPPVPVAAADL